MRTLMQNAIEALVIAVIIALCLLILVNFHAFRVNRSVVAWKDGRIEEFLRFLEGERFNGEDELVRVSLASEALLSEDAPRYREYVYGGAWRADKWFSDPQTLALCEAAARGDVEGTRAAIAGGADVNARGEKGMPLLMWSTFCEKEVFEELLAAGADPNFRVDSATYGVRASTDGRLPDGQTFLEFIMYLAGREDFRAYYFKGYAPILLRYGADPNVFGGRAISTANSAYSRNWPTLRVGLKNVVGDVATKADL